MLGYLYKPFRTRDSSLIFPNFESACTLYRNIIPIFFYSIVLLKITVESFLPV
jgi:hypothetical protein